MNDNFDNFNTRSQSPVVQSGMTDINNMLQQALRSYSGGIQQQRAAQMQQLGNIESTMYDQIGRAQLQSEREIAQRRMQALRSGMPSSQLAALELQNVQTAQLGAQQMAQQYDQLRMQLGTELAGAENMFAADLAQQMVQSRTDLEAIEGQRYASDIGAQMSGMLSGWGNMSDLQRLQAVQAMNNPEFMGSQANFVSQMGIQTPDGTVPDVSGETSRNVVKGEDGQPMVDPQTGQPLQAWNPTGIQEQHQKNSIQREFLSLEGGGSISEVTGNRIWATNELTSQNLGVGFNAGKDGGDQNNWINRIQQLALAGDFKAGDVIDFNYGAGSDWYLYTGDGFIAISSISASNARQINSKGNRAWVDTNWRSSSNDAFSKLE